VVQPDREKYYLVELVGDSRGRVYKEEYVDGRVGIKKEFKPELTIQYARNFFMFNKAITLRGGLKESSGGIGLDFYPIPSTKLFVDLWDFGRRDRPEEEDLKPLLQIGISYKFNSPLFLRFGADDLLNDKLRGFFFGAGLLFTDNDLKYLIGGMGIPKP
jgi:phospholipid/cholesterol/gamma-HCH transport system substrate-binding protein